MTDKLTWRQLVETDSPAQRLADDWILKWECNAELNAVLIRISEGTSDSLMSSLRRHTELP